MVSFCFCYHSVKNCIHTVNKTILLNTIIEYIVYAHIVNKYATTQYTSYIFSRTNY